MTHLRECRYRRTAGRVADILFVMETRQAKRLKTLFPAGLRDKKLVVLGIPDRYAAGDPALIARLEPLLRAALHL